MYGHGCAGGGELRCEESQLIQHFRPGDTVVCIDASDSFLEQGRRYVVDRVRGIHISITCMSRAAMWRMDRFEKADKDFLVGSLKR
jgi:hypothetical protein